MARPKKQTVDYFPHIAKSGKTILMLESRWKNDGYAFWFKLLEILCQSEGHVSDYGNPLDREFILAKTLVSDETATEILNKLAETGKIDSELWTKKLIWCQSLVDNIKDAYKKRINELPEKPVSSTGNHVKTEFQEEETTLELVSGNGSTESKVKESKVDKSKLNNKYTNDFEMFWSLYPEGANKKDKSTAFKNYNNLLKKVSFEIIIGCVKNYATDCLTLGTDFIFAPKNFVGRNAEYKNYLPGEWTPAKSKQQTSKPKYSQNTTANAINDFFTRRPSNGNDNRRPAAETTANSGDFRTIDISISKCKD